MKHLFKLLVILLPIFGMAQDTVVTLTPAMFDKRFDQTFLDTKNGWTFKQGNDTAWAKTDVNSEGWKKLKPVDLSAKYADKNGRVEGWFRIKIKFDKALANEQLDLRWTSWAATDIYINGRLFSSFGNTGQNGKPYLENRVQIDDWPPAANFKTGDEYLIAVHFVDYLSPLPPIQLKYQQSYGVALRLTASKGRKLMSNFATNSIIYFGIWASVCTILSLLSWLLYIQNPAEKVLRLMATCSTFFALVTYFLVFNYINLSFIAVYLSGCAFVLLIELIFITIPVIFANIFNRAISRKFMVLLVGIVLYSLIINFLPDAALIPLGVADLLLIIVCIYYIVSSWRKLHGAQWCIVVGLLTAVAFLITLVIAVTVNPDAATLGFVFSLITGFLLSFPLSMLVYVAMRFREIIAEVRQNAQEVVRLSEEKREEALNRQKVLQEEVDRQTFEIRTTLDHLKATQTQLIQSEKMASLGELTAGIAHEIQNPLNFVNNFSEVNQEMIGELEEELKAGNIDEAFAIAADIKQNEEKINHHGKRADSIVKGMLEHSRAGSGTKEATDINKLADEYLRLAYHGLRAKDKSFNAELITHFDESLPLVNIIPQDIGRVMLNLFNNAFYAVNQKQKTTGEGYKGKVSVSTSLENGLAVIKVKDNGIGIPDAIKEKIMQPFFTTKPTGEGTGLGLSLTYDMVVKGHGGTIQVNSVEAEGSEFIITLPIS